MNSSLAASDAQVAAELARVRIEPVLTAHPTEAKRYTVLEQHRSLYLLLVQLENPMWTPQEQRTICDSIKIALDRLWRTGEIYLEKPDVASEVRSVVYYLRRVFPSSSTRSTNVCIRHGSRRASTRRCWAIPTACPASHSGRGSVGIAMVIHW